MRRCTLAWRCPGPTSLSPPSGVRAAVLHVRSRCTRAEPSVGDLSTLHGCGVERRRQPFFEALSARPYGSAHLPRHPPASPHLHAAPACDPGVSIISHCRAQHPLTTLSLHSLLVPTIGSARLLPHPCPSPALGAGAALCLASDCWAPQLACVSPCGSPRPRAGQRVCRPATVQHRAPRQPAIYGLPRNSTAFLLYLPL